MVHNLFCVIRLRAVLPHFSINRTEGWRYRCRRLSYVLLNGECNEQVIWEQLSLFSLISWDYIHVKGCVIWTQPLPKGHVPLVMVLTANLLLILTVHKNIVRSDEITSGEESVGVQVPARPETPFHNTPP